MRSERNTGLFDTGRKTGRTELAGRRDGQGKIIMPPVHHRLYGATNRGAIPKKSSAHGRLTYRSRTQQIASYSYDVNVVASWKVYTLDTQLLLLLGLYEIVHEVHKKKEGRKKLNYDVQTYSISATISNRQKSDGSRSTWSLIETNSNRNFESRI